MRTMKNTLYGGIMCLLFSIISCKKTYEFSVSGKVTNTITGEPLEGVLVVVQDGLSTNSLLSEETSPSVGSTTKTNENGEYQLYLKSNESWHAVVYSSSELYVYERMIESTSQNYEFLREGENDINFPLEGIAYFNAPFHKNSGIQQNTDSLILSLLDYYDKNVLLQQRKPKSFRGSGPFYFYDSTSEIIAKGDRYLRYKIEWTDNGVWKSKIDSVYLPTSLEVYTDTIFY